MRPLLQLGNSWLPQDIIGTTTLLDVSCHASFYGGLQALQVGETVNKFSPLAI